MLTHRQLSGVFLWCAKHAAKFQWQKRTATKAAVRMVQWQLTGAFSSWSEHALVAGRSTPRSCHIEIFMCAALC